METAVTITMIWGMGARTRKRSTIRRKMRMTTGMFLCDKLFVSLCFKVAGVNGWKRSFPVCCDKHSRFQICTHFSSLRHDSRILRQTASNETISCERCMLLPVVAAAFHDLGNFILLCHFGLSYILPHALTMRSGKRKRSRGMGALFVLIKQVQNPFGLGATVVLFFS